MRNILALLTIIVISIGAGGCSRDQGEGVAFGSGEAAEDPKGAVAPPARVLVNRHQKDLTCPTGYEDYCGGWTIESAHPDLATKHIALNDRFVIGQKGTPTWLFARQSLMSRWNNTPKIRLHELTDCLAGKIRLTSHDDSHEWHKLTITKDVITVPEIGDEVDLEICFEVAPNQNSSPPTSCTLDCPEVNPDKPEDHGGIAHGKD